jgi:Protein of unknown function (DUF1552)
MSTNLKGHKDMSTKISRRLLLSGAGVTVALPFLPSALWSRRASAAAATPPRRFMAWFVPNGFNMPDWTPTKGTTAGVADWLPTKISMPLEPIRKKILILTGLDMQMTAVPGNPPGDHGAGTGSFLNMLSVNGHETDKTRVSLDQVLLPALNPAGATQPLLPSLQLGVQGDNGLCDRVSCDFSRAISWTAGTPMPNIYDPGLAWDRMFKNFTAPAATNSTDAAQRLAEKTSVLDRVKAQADALALKLNPSDKRKMDEYTTALRALETKLQAQSTAKLTCTPSARPVAGEILNFDRGITPSTILQKHVPMHLELMKLAFQCDITRSITFMMGNGTSNNDFGFVTGGSAPHHGTSHHGGSASQLAKLTQIDTWEMLQMSTLLQSLDAIKEGPNGESILDSTTFYMGSDVGDGNTHNHWDQPVLLAGGASGKLKIDGRHINYLDGKMTFPRPLVGPQGGPHTGRVLIAILNAHGMMQTTFGQATGGPLPELMA